MYSIYHPDFIWQRWHVFIAYIVVTWMTCLTVMFMNKSLPLINQLGMFFILAGFLISTVVCAIMPSKNGNGYATNEFVWQDFQNDTGYSSSGLVFCLGMLNGAFAVGTPGKYIPSSVKG
jgi:choline transport protein